MTHEKAIDGCKRQDRISQKFLFDAYSDSMLMLCVRYVKNLADAEELMLNGFYSFYKNIDRFVYSGSASITAWLKKIMVNECLMFLRKTNLLRIVPEEHAEDMMSATALLETISANEILKALTLLPAGYRTVFNLYVVEGYAHKEIADLLNITEGTSKSQLSKAKAMLQEMIRKNGCYYES